MMIKEIRRELKRQLQEMIQFKFNLFFANFGILIMVSAYLQYFKDVQSKYLLLCLLFTWYFTSHAITHPTFFIEDDLYDRTLISIIQSSKSILHVLMVKIIVQILVDFVKAIPIFIVLSMINHINFPDDFFKLVGSIAACMLSIISMYGFGFCLSSLCFIFNRTSSITSLISYFMLYFTGILAPLSGILREIGKLFPYYTLRNFIIYSSYQSVFLIIIYGAIYWSVGTLLFVFLLKIAKKRGSLFHV
ncbi:MULTISPECIES: ABC transporter permease [Streptococcus]|uniref:ABC transporter permease n=2 Tax=Streptococcus TaxID=1301 RepID=A0A7X6MW87_9STRE|nr:ABC transporter permease [Streptococcus ovuberis]